MHICILYQHYLRPGDAGHNRINDYARIWSVLGCKVSVITGQASYMTGIKDSAYYGQICVQERDGAVEVYRTYVPDRANASFLRRGVSYLTFAVSSAWGFRGLERPDVLLCSSPPLFVGLGMLLIRRFRRIPVVFEVRDLWPESAVAAGVVGNRTMITWMYRLERRCYAVASRIIVLTEAFRENILVRKLAEPTKVCYLPNGVDTETENPGLRSEALRRELGWEGRFVVLYSGAHGVANRVGQLVDAALLLRDVPEVLIATVGAGMELEPLRKRVVELGLTNVVLHGPRPREQMSAITASADACAAVLQKNDTFRTVYPNKVFDAMACARPIVLGIDGVARELVERAGAGFFAEPENPRSLADAITTLSQDRNGAAAMGRSGRQYVIEHFDRLGLARRYLAELEAVMEMGA